jgi:hypothetical protein
MHRWIWDLHYTSVAGVARFGDDELGSAPPGVTALPGTYKVTLTVAGQSYSQPLTVKMDPRIKTPPADLQQQFEIAIEVSRRQSEISEAQRSVKQLLSQARQLRPQARNNAALAAALDALVQKADDIGGTLRNRFAPSNRPPKEQSDMASLSSKFAAIFSAVNSGDEAPTAEARKAFASTQQNLTTVMANWTALIAKDLPAMNTQLKQAGLAPIIIGPNGPAPTEKQPSESDDN